jgi:predicted esterase
LSSTLLAALVPLGLLAAPPPASAGDAFPAGAVTEKVTCRSDPTQTYTLYLPSAYTPERRWPGLLIFDPRGRATPAAEIFRAAAERYGWLLLSSDNTRSDGPWEPNARALAALWPEVRERFAVDPRRIYAAGFSGGAIAAWLLGGKTGGLAGVIASGGRLNPGVSPDTFAFAHYGAAGDTDFNYGEMGRVDAILEEKGLPHRLEVFTGAHRWLPPELAMEAVQWMELQAMKEHRRPGDPALVAELFRQDVARARELERGGRALAARRRYRAIALTFSGLHDVGEAPARAAALAASAEAERKQEERWDAYEERYLRRDLPPVVLAIRSSEAPIPLAQLLSDLKVPELRRQARETSYAGTAARRILEAVYVQASFYLARDLLQGREHGRAVLALQVAAAIKDDDPTVQYNLACAFALAGRKGPALQALSRAVDLGYRDRRHLEEDADLVTLRGEKAYAAILGRLPAEPGASPR